MTVALRVLRYVALALIGANLQACGGSGGGGDDEDEEETPPPVTLEFSARQQQIPAGNTVTFDWASTAATSCTASGGWTGVQVLSGSKTLGPLETSQSYTLTCTGPGGSESRSLTITVTPRQIALGHFSFVTLGGRPGHTAELEDSGEPVPGNARYHAYIVGSLSGVTVIAEGEDGAELAASPATATLAGIGTATLYTGTLAVPDKPFRIRVRGVSGSATVTQLASRLYGPQFLSVRFVSPIPALAQGAPTRVALEVTDAAAPTRVRVSCSSNPSRRIEPKPVVQTSAGQLHTVMVSVPASQEQIPKLELRCTAVRMGSTQPAANEDRATLYAESLLTSSP